MRMSQLFGHTLRQAPSEAQAISHQLLLRAGMIRSSAPGIYTCLPLGRRVLQKIEQVVRQKMEAIGGQELLMPRALPAREVVTGLAHREVESYRQLPVLVYDIRPESREEYRIGLGLMDTQEYVALRGIGFHAASESLEDAHLRLHQAYENIFEACGLETITVETKDGHEFMVPFEASQRVFILCSEGDYASPAEEAKFAKPEGPQEPEREMEKVATPGCKTMAALASYLDVPLEKTLKVVFYATEDGKVIIAIIRGDFDISEAKLKDALGIAGDLYIATEREILNVGAVPGYGSPIGVHGARLVADDSVLLGSNFVAGANEEGYHLLNVNYHRDFQVDILTDIARARAGYACPRCHSPLKEIQGIELGHLKRGERINATYLDQAGQPQPIVTNSYSLDLSRLMAAAVEQHHDQQGIVWPTSIAPFQVHLVVLGVDDEVTAKAEEVYANLRALGYEVLYDDRNESAGVKFNDADLIGIPVRLTLSRRTVKENAIEVKLRREMARETVSISNLSEVLSTRLA